jgi:hypothetical protein
LASSQRLGLVIRQSPKLSFRSRFAEGSLLGHLARSALSLLLGNGRVPGTRVLVQVAYCTDLLVLVLPVVRSSQTWIDDANPLFLVLTRHRFPFYTTHKSEWRPERFDSCSSPRLLYSSSFRIRGEALVTWHL